MVAALFAALLCSCSDDDAPAPQALGTPVVTIGATTETTADFSWTAVEHAAGYDWAVAWYNSSSASNDQELTIAWSGSTTATQVAVEGLIPGTSYVVRVVARADESGAWSDSAYGEATFSTAESTTVTFADEVLRRHIFALEPAVDADGDGEISFEEAATVTTLDIGFYNAEEIVPEDVVTDLSGLEHFTALETLNLRYHGVSDATPVEGLSALKMLVLAGNPVSELDLSALGNLTDLRLFDTQISELDLTATPHLVDLYLQRMPIRSLDLSGLDELETVTANEAQLTSLRAVGLPALMRLDAVSNAIAELEISGCPELMQLHLNGNALTEAVFTDLPKLMILNVYENQLTSLDVKGLPFLMNLYVFGNALTEIDLSGNPILRNFYGSDNPLREVSFAANPGLWCVELENCPNLETIDLKNDGFEEWDAEYYIAEGNTALKRVVVDAGGEYDYVAGIFRNMPQVSVVTE